MVSPSSSERIRPRDHGRASFYTRFYTAGRDWLVRSGTDWHVECAKPQLRGTRRYGTGRQERLGILITRRSQVQILPPPPTCESRPRSATWALLVVGVFYRVRVVFYRVFNRLWEARGFRARPV